jgi:hypothetical protein
MATDPDHRYRDVTMLLEELEKTHRRISKLSPERVMKRFCSPSGASPASESASPRIPWTIIASIGAAAAAGGVGWFLMSLLY